jgi:hypothetical protein
MLRQLKTFIRFTQQDRNLVLRATTALVVCRVRLRLQGIEKIRAWASRRGNGTAAPSQLTWAIEIVSRRVPGTTCLSKALALQHLLSESGHRSELKIGVDNAQEGFVAHAWLLFDEEILIGGGAAEKYKLLAAWPTYGAFREADPDKQERHEFSGSV